LGKVELHPAVFEETEALVAKARSPGMKHKHYAPNADVIVVEGEVSAIVGKAKELTKSFVRKGKRVGVLATDETADYYRANAVKSLGSRSDLATMAKNLFRLLREFDLEGIDIIIAEGVPSEGLGLAVMNRLRKASGYNIVKAKD
jgi:L-threonylcarbamoyladenylate synthase